MLKKASSFISQITMMLDKEFIVVNSNGSLSTFPQNNPTNFKIHLAKPLVLGDASKWRVALKEVSLPKSNILLESDFLVAQVLLIDNISLVNSKSKIWKKLMPTNRILSKGPYLTTNKLIEAINQLLKLDSEVTDESPTVFHNSSTNCIEIKAGIRIKNDKIYGYIFPWFELGLAKVLGVTQLYKDTFIIKPELRQAKLLVSWNTPFSTHASHQLIMTVDAPLEPFPFLKEFLFQIELNPEFQSYNRNMKSCVSISIRHKLLYVTSDLVIPSRINDTLMHLLDVIHNDTILTPTEFAITKMNNKLNYLGLSKPFIDTIDIQILDENGEQAILTDGVTTISLIFKQIL